MIDDTINQTARRVAIHQAVDEIVDARRRMGGDGPAEALSDALSHLAAVALDDHPDAGSPSPYDLMIESAWQAVAAIAQGQLEEAMEERAS